MPLYRASGGAGGVTLPIAESDVTNLPTDLSGKAATSHTHAEADVTSLVADLAAKALATRTVALTDGATIATNADTTDVGTVTLGGNRTISNPTGTPVAGQRLIYRLKQDGTGTRTITWGANFRFSAGTATTLTTTINKTDYIGFQWNATDSKWDCVSERLNF